MRHLRSLTSLAAFALLSAAAAAPASGDLVIEYSHKSKNSSFSLTYSSGSNYNYGFGGCGGFGSSYGFGGSSIFAVNGGSFSDFNGYLLPGVYYTSPFSGAYGAYGQLANDPLGFGYSPSSRPRRGYDDATAFDAESLRREYFGVEGHDSYIPGGDAGTVAARLARTAAVREGLKQLHDGHYADAILTLRAAYLRDTKDPGTKIFYGLSLIPVGEYELAEKAIRRGIEESTSKAGWLVEVAKLYGNPKDLAGNVLLLSKRSDKRDPLSAAFLLGYILASQGQYDEALRYLNLLGPDAGKPVEMLRALIQSKLAH